MVAIMQQRTWTNGKATNRLRSLQSCPMRLYALETHIKISRNLKKFVDLMRNHRSGPEPSPCPLQAQASGPKILETFIVGCNGSVSLVQDTMIGLQDYWRHLSAKRSIVSCRTANRISSLPPVVDSASLLSGTAIFLFGG